MIVASTTGTTATATGASEASSKFQNLNVNISPTTTTFSPYTLNPAPLPVPPPSPFLTPYGYTQPSPTTSTSSCAGGSTPAEGMFSNYQNSGRMSRSANIERGLTVGRPLYFDAGSRELGDLDLWVGDLLKMFESEI